MKIGKSQTIALDVDDVLFDCLRKMTEEALKIGIQVKYEDLVDYHFKNFPDEVAAKFLDIMKQPEFYQSQVPFPGAREMIDELLDAGHEVVIASAVPPQMMGYRSELLLQVFPRLNPRNIMLGARKDLLHVDFLLDDAMHNISTSPAKHPVVFTRPWNLHAEDCLRVSSYADFIHLVEAVSLAPSIEETHLNQVGRPGLLCLVGPSASGKSFICDEVVRNPFFRKVRAVTTRKPRPGEMALNEYRFVSEKEFAEFAEQGALVEQTVYAGSLYGITKEEIENIWHSGQIAIKPVDINGALACKRAYGDRCVTVFIRRNREDVIKALLDREMPNDDKAKRLMTLNAEYDNESLCDWTVSNNDSLENAVKQIMRIVY